MASLADLLQGGANEDEAKAFADRPTLAEILEGKKVGGLRSYLPSNDMLRWMASPLIAARDSIAEGVDLAQRAGLSKSLQAVPVAAYEAGKNLLEGGITAIDEWTQGVRGHPEVIGNPLLVKRGTEEYEPPPISQNSMLAPTGLAGMGTGLARASVGASREAVRPSLNAEGLPSEVPGGSVSRPNELLSDAGKRSSLPGAIANGMNQGIEGAGRNVEKVTPALEQDFGSIAPGGARTLPRRVMRALDPEGDGSLGPEGMRIVPYKGSGLTPEDLGTDKASRLAAVADRPWYERLAARLPVGAPGIVITKNGNPVGRLGYEVYGDTAYIYWVNTEKGGRLSTAEWRELREEFRRMHPEVTTFEGVRISGAHAKANADPHQSVTIRADQERGSAVGAAVSALNSTERRGDRTIGEADASSSLKQSPEKAKAVKDLYARQGLPVAGEEKEDKRSKPSDLAKLLMQAH